MRKNEKIITYIAFFPILQTLTYQAVTKINTCKGAQLCYSSTHTCKILMKELCQE